MELNKLSTYQLICDLACQLLDENVIATHERSKVSMNLNSDEILSILIKKTKKDFGLNIIGWANWYLEDNSEIDGLEKTNLLGVIVNARISKIENNTG